MGRSKCLAVNWKVVNGAAHGRRKLIIRQNEKSLFSCPIRLCLHEDFKSSRGLRKHIDNKHGWYYYFDEQPNIKREDLKVAEKIKEKNDTSKKPAFSLDEGIGLEFLQWLGTTCGGGKNTKESQQTGKRAMKFLMESYGINDSDLDLTYEFVDCCLSSPNIFISFLQTLENDWNLTSSASLNYVKSIEDLLDFRKTRGVSDNTLRCFTVTEIYLRRAKENLGKKKRVECHRNLNLESLIAKNSWATIEEMEKVIPFHITKYKNIINKCKISSKTVNKGDFVFCTRFVATLLFLRVKCSRPMTFQYLTLSMIEKAKSNGGFIDQTEFKTSSKYLFDTLIITEDVMKAIELYIAYVRTKLSPKCNYLLLSTNGSQFKSLTTAMTMLVKEAIGKYINPTRYRQIIETESSERLSKEEQEVISEDQKHSSTVAKIYYKKKQSRVIAIEGKKCMDKMTKDSRYDSSLDMLNDIDKRFDSSVLELSKNIVEQDSVQASPFSPYNPGSHTITKPTEEDVLQKRTQSLLSTFGSSSSNTEDDIETSGDMVFVIVISMSSSVLELEDPKLT